MPHMMDFPLLLSTLYDRAVRLYPEQEIVSVEADRTVTPHHIRRDRRQGAQAGDRLGERFGVDAGDPVGTFAWNNQRHHELYWTTANTGQDLPHDQHQAVRRPDRLHHQPRRRPGPLRGSRPCPLVESLAPQLETVEHYVVMGDDASAPPQTPSHTRS